MDYFVRAKFYAMRSAIYYQITQYVLIVILFLRPYELSIYLEIGIILFIGVLVVFVGMIDRKIGILKKEQSIANSENAELTEIRDLLRDMNKPKYPKPNIKPVPTHRRKK